MALLAQVVATFLSLLATFFAAYFIFLSSSRASVDADIQREGSYIVEELRRSPTYDAPIPYRDMFLLSTYQARHPDATGAMLLYQLAYTLNSTTMFDEPAADLFDVAVKGNVPGEAAGRLALWIVQQAVGSLVPNQIGWPGRPSQFAQAPRFEPPPQVPLFPFGTIGVDTWRSEFRIVRDAITLLSWSRDQYLDNFRKFVEEAKSTTPSLAAGRSLEFDYADWLRKMDGTVDAIAVHDSRLASLLQLRESLAVKARIPGLGWVGLLALLLALVGVFLPILFSALQLEATAPVAVNVTFVVVAFVLLGGTCWLLGHDIALSPEHQLAKLRYLGPLRSQLKDEQKKGRTEVSFGFGLVTATLRDPNIRLPGKASALLENYRDALRASNAAAETLSGVVATALRADEKLAKYQADAMAGGRTIAILEPVDAAGMDKMLAGLKAGMSYIIQDGRGHVTTDVFKFSLVTDGDVSIASKELGALYKTIRDSQEYRTYAEANARTEQVRRKCLDWLEAVIGSGSG